MQGIFKIKKNLRVEEGHEYIKVPLSKLRTPIAKRSNSPVIIQRNVTRKSSIKYTEGISNFRGASSSQALRKHLKMSITPSENSKSPEKKKQRTPSTNLRFSLNPPTLVGNFPHKTPKKFVLMAPFKRSHPRSSLLVEKGERLQNMIRFEERATSTTPDPPSLPNRVYFFANIAQELKNGDKSGPHSTYFKEMYSLLRCSSMYVDLDEEEQKKHIEEIKIRRVHVNRLDVEKPNLILDLDETLVHIKMLGEGTMEGIKLRISRDDSCRVIHRFTLR